jgi:aspartyl protease family protein
MTSGTRQLLKEAALWLIVFTAALAGFLYLDGQIGNYLTALNGAETTTGRTENKNAPPEADHHRQLEEFKKRHKQWAKNNTDDDVGGYGRVILHAGPKGHFRVNAYINNRKVAMMADTGATYVALSWKDARHLGLTHNLEYTGRARTANGTSKIAPVMLDSIQIGDIKIYDVQGIVSERGKLDTSLLGMSFLGKLERFEMSGRRLVLYR